MNGNCHFVFGAATAFTASEILISINNIDYLHPLFNQPSAGYIIAAFVSSCLIGSVFPDIDNPKSHFGQLTKPVSTFIGKIGKMNHHTGSHHRGLFHDPGIYALVMILLYYIIGLSNMLPILGFFVGAYSHLFLDMFNPAGIRIFGVKFLRLAKIPSESKEAVFLTWILVLIVFVIGVRFDSFYQFIGA